MQPDHRQLETKTNLQRIMLADNTGSLNSVTFDDTVMATLKSLESGQVRKTLVHPVKT